MEKIEFDVARRYVACILNENGRDPMTNDAVRRMLHDVISRRLGVSHRLISRAAYTVEYYTFSDSALLSEYADESILAKIFKKNLDDIYDAQQKGEVNESSLIATWTFEMLHPDLCYIGGLSRD